MIEALGWTGGESVSDGRALLHYTAHDARRAHRVRLGGRPDGARARARAGAWRSTTRSPRRRGATCCASSRCSRGGASPTRGAARSTSPPPTCPSSTSLPGLPAGRRSATRATASARRTCSAARWLRSRSTAATTVTRLPVRRRADAARAARAAAGRRRGGRAPRARAQGGRGGGGPIAPTPCRAPSPDLPRADRAPHRPLTHAAARAPQCADVVASLPPDEGAGVGGQAAADRPCAARGADAGRRGALPRRPRPRVDRVADRAARRAPARRPRQPRPARCSCEVEVDDLHLRRTTRRRAHVRRLRGLRQLRQGGPHMYTQRQASKLAKKLPAADVLICHCPPLGDQRRPDDPRTSAIEGPARLGGAPPARATSSTGTSTRSAGSVDDAASATPGSTGSRARRC